MLLSISFIYIYICVGLLRYGSVKRVPLNEEDRKGMLQVQKKRRLPFLGETKDQTWKPLGDITYDIVFKKISRIITIKSNSNNKNNIFCTMGV